MEPSRPQAVILIPLVVLSQVRSIYLRSGTARRQRILKQYRSLWRQQERWYTDTNLRFVKFLGNVASKASGSSWICSQGREAS
jgi:hypothetical protein